MIWMLVPGGSPCPVFAGTVTDPTVFPSGFLMITMVSVVLMLMTVVPLGLQTEQERDGKGDKVDEGISEEGRGEGEMGSLELGSIDWLELSKGTGSERSILELEEDISEMVSLDSSDLT